VSNSGEIGNTSKKKRPTRADVDTLSSQLAEAAGARETAQKQASDLQTQIKSLSARVTELETLASERERQAKLAQEEAGESRAKLGELERRSSELSSQAARVGPLEEEVATLSWQLEESNRILGEVRKRAEGLGESERQLRAKGEELTGASEAASKEVAQLRAEMKSQERSRIQAITRAEEAERHLASLGKDLEGSREEARKRADASTESERQLGSKCEELTRANEAASKENAQLRSQVQTQEETRGQAVTRAEEAERRLASLGKDLEALREEARKRAEASGETERQLGSKCEELTRANEAGSKENAQLQSQVKAQEETRRETVNRAEEAERRLETLGKDLEGSRLETREAKDRTADLDRRVAELSAESNHFASLEKEVLALGEQAEGLRGELSQAKEALVQGEEDKKRLRAQADEASKSREAALRQSELEKGKAVEGEKALTLTKDRLAEGERKLRALESELAESKARETKAQEAAREITASRAEIARQAARIKKLEEMRSSLQGQLEILGRSLTPGESAPLESPAEANPNPPAPVRDAPPSSTEESRPAPPEASEPAPAAPPPSEAPIPAAPPTPETVPAGSSSVGSTTIRHRPVDLADAVQDPRNFFGPSAEDGKPAHVLLGLISRDNLGAVYRACERSTGNQFAVRFMPGQAGEEQSAAIEREVELLIAVPHPNIHQVRGSGHRQSRLYITMDLVEAPSLLEAKIREIPRICALVRDAAQAVHYAHEEGILHGDLNPDNILVTQENDQDHALVKNFGLGHLLEGLGPQTTAKEAALLIRFPAYLPPEQMKEMKGRLSVAGDVYGLGATLYAALAGRPPFEGVDARHVSTRVVMEEPTPLERVRPDVPESLASVVRRAMAKEKDHRYGTARELAQALTKFLEGLPMAPRQNPAAQENRAF
jgi:hypothetical protein